jgi:hypothetical protein
MCLNLFDPPISISLPPSLLPSLPPSHSRIFPLSHSLTHSLSLSLSLSLSVCVCVCLQASKEFLARRSKGAISLVLKLPPDLSAADRSEYAKTLNPNLNVNADDLNPKT